MGFGYKGTPDVVFRSWANRLKRMRGRIKSLEEFQGDFQGDIKVRDGAQDELLVYNPTLRQWENKTYGTIATNLTDYEWNTNFYPSLSTGASTNLPTINYHVLSTSGRLVTGHFRASCTITPGSAGVYYMYLANIPFTPLSGTQFICNGLVNSTTGANQFPATVATCFNPSNTTYIRIYRDGVAGAFTTASIVNFFITYSFIREIE